MNDQEFDHTHREVPRHIHPEIREHRERAEFHTWWVGGWFWPTAAAAFTVLWTLLIYSLIGQRPTDWNYGVTPYIPAQSFLSSTESSGRECSRQVILPIEPKGEEREER